jgi:hypothetical protein
MWHDRRRSMPRVYVPLLLCRCAPKTGAAGSGPRCTRPGPACREPSAVQPMATFADHGGAFADTAHAAKTCASPAARPAARDAMPHYRAAHAQTWALRAPASGSARPASTHRPGNAAAHPLRSRSTLVTDAIQRACHVVRYQQCAIRHHLNVHRASPVGVAVGPAVGERLVLHHPALRVERHLH